MTDGVEHLARELRRWTERPGSLSPRVARTRVLARLPRRRRRSVWHLAVAGGALTATALALALIVGRGGEPLAGPPRLAASAQRTIVHQLSSGTKLYIVIQPSAAADDSRHGATQRRSL